ncbi:E3 ubiquitin-protein ligase TRIM71-like isoform X3 [Rhopilema esculentum]|uniref:E3 ubiquitin-protein ligase TRIM71-like isoform X3 n=1 Tax=Rhopilema esculentum TaxID=499914 RepID=UPI0031D70B0A
MIINFFKRISAPDNSEENRSVIKEKEPPNMASAREEPQHRLANKIPEELICALCGEMYNDPRLLPCLHTFCKRCLEHTVNPRSATITCHSCRKEVSLMAKGVKDFPPNFIILNMLDFVAVKNSDKKPILCSSCNEQLPATARCIDCMDFLCYACHSAHGRVRITKDHQILTLEQIKMSEDAWRLLHRPITCAVHPVEKIQYFCLTCQDTICRECTMTQHPSSHHEYTILSKAVDVQKGDIMSLHRALQQKVPLLSRACQDIDETARKLDARSDLIRNEIQERTPRLIRLLQERESQLLADLDVLVMNKKKVLKKQMDLFDQEFKRLSTSTNFTEQVLSFSSEAELLTIKKQLCENLKNLLKLQLKLEPDENDHLSCDTNVDSITSSIQQFGQIATKEVEILRCSIDGEMESNVSKGKTVNLSLAVRNQFGIERRASKDSITAELRTPDTGIIIPEIKEKSDGTFSMSYRTYSVGQHQLTIRYNNQHIPGSPFIINALSDSTNAISKHSPIKIPNYSRPENSYEQHTSIPINHVEPRLYVKSIGRKGQNFGEFNGVFAVAVDVRQRRILATDYNNHRVQVFDEQGNFLFLFGERGMADGQFQSPTGIGVGPGGEIIVCERLKGRIQVFGNDGTFQRRYLLNELKASALTVDFSGRIIIADYTNCCIYILDPILERWSKFGAFGYGPGELQYPCYVTTNKDGHIFVSDMHNSKIQVYDGEGIFRMSYGRKGEKDGELQRPTGIAVDQKGRLIIADRDNHRIQVFAPSGEFLMKFGSKGEREGELNDPHGLAVLSDGRVAEADFRNNRIQLFGF